MVSRQVAWGSGGPNISGSMQSLGASLAEAVGGGGVNNRAARDAAYMESLQHHNQVYDNQAAAIAAKQAADQAEADRKANDYRLQTDAGGALGESAAVALPHPALVLNPGDPAIVKYNADTDAVRKGAQYVLAGGGNADSRAKGFKEFYNPLPVPVEEQKPIFDSQHTRRLVPDAQDPSGYRSVPVGGAPAPSSTQKPTAENLKAAGFVPRLEDANKIMSDPKVAAASQSLTDRALDYVPVIGRFFQSEDFKRLSDAEKDMVTAVLRDESGATIQDSEFVRDADKYFPRRGDTPQILADKANRRRIQIESMKLKAGPALQEGAAPEATGSVTTNESAAPYPGASQAPDGHWYVKQGGKYFRVDN
jgi:hypothetical protein